MPIFSANAGNSVDVSTEAEHTDVTAIYVTQLQLFNCNLPLPKTFFLFFI